MKQVYHPYWLWECYKNGFYENSPPKGMTDEYCANYYKEFLSNLVLFEETLFKVINEWKYSCEHFLTNNSLNKIAWLGQASLCIHSKIPSKYRYGYKYLSLEKRIKADNLAGGFYKKWKKKYMNTLNNGEKGDIQVTSQMKFQWF